MNLLKFIAHLLCIYKGASKEDEQLYKDLSSIRLPCTKLSKKTYLMLGARLTVDPKGTKKTFEYFAK